MISRVIESMTRHRPFRADDMKHALLTLLVVFVASAIAGGHPAAFLIAACVICAVRWGAYFRYPRARRRYLILDPKTPDVKSLAAALGSMLDEALRSQKTVVLRVATFTADPRFRPRLNLTPKDEIEISGCPRKHLLPHPGAWLADHPLPFAIPLTRSLTLAFSPCQGARIRVTENTPPPLPRRVWIGIILLITLACCLNLNTLLAALLAFSGEMHLTRR